MSISNLICQFFNYYNDFLKLLGGVAFGSMFIYFMFNLLQFNTCLRCGSIRIKVSS